MTAAARQRICFVVSSPLTVRAFLAKHIAVLSNRFEVSVVANANPQALAVEVPQARFFNVPIVRAISPLRDALAAIHLFLFFREQGFAVVHSVTPKAGLLSMVAAWLARVPVRVHTFTGQVWVTRKGPMRVLLRQLDALIARLATHVLVDSRSQREFLIANGVVSAAKATVLGEGSICGVDERFRPDEAARIRVRSVLGLPRDAVLYLYLGRVSRDKGVTDLARAFAALAKRYASAYLLIAGPDEEGLMTRVEELLDGHRDRFRRIDFTDRPEEYMAAADVFCLPSYREGFGQVAIEASAAELPVIASRIYGVIDAVVEGETGLLHAPGDVAGLTERMRTLIEHPEMRGSLGSAGRARVLREFSAERVTQALRDYYSEVTGKL
ncbi:MAG TPA: glycosyltransferase [Burkholderiales bacterium]|nr:glycosyltransferase [Burkholderiales bacterium]